MNRRIVRTATVVALVLLVLGADAVHAKKYQYGRYRAGGAQQAQGFIVFLEGIAANPRNTDNVVATIESGGLVVSSVIPQWDTEFAGRIGFGYRWASGNIVEASFWGFNTDTQITDTGTGVTHFSIGPAICSVTPCAGANGSPGYFDITTEITAQTADVAWGRAMQLSDDVTMEWSLGLRFASYEETAEGTYGDTEDSTDLYDAAKSNEGNMFGVRAALRGRYMFLENFSVSGGLAFSALDGELEASSGLSPDSGQPSSFASIIDDSRSGTIRDLDLVFAWHAMADSIRVYGGWEQSEWRDIATDLMRNLPGSTVVLRDRDSVIFSGYKLGVYLRF
jgi:hypothetical protein